MSFDKSALLAALKPVVKDVDVQGFGLVHIKQLSVSENDIVRAAAKPDGSPSAFGLRLVLASVVDDEGQPVFTEADMQILGEASGTKIEALVNHVLEVNGFKSGASEKN